jgi:hypothetical protein
MLMPVFKIVASEFAEDESKVPFKFSEGIVGCSN